MTNALPRTLHVSLPSGLAAIVERALASGAFVDEGEFVRFLVRAHQATIDERERVERLLAVEDDCDELASLDAGGR